ncbi:uncharacterized protein [Rutidosis leptorrhynchoides]|uniref:uncharacterized protein n=1 Tax=Rutidosis leptorrhynchoides TaxID=125765 RepID=UPI003A9A316D
MNSSNSNSTYGFRDSNETGSANLGFNSPRVAGSRVPVGTLGSNLSRPRLMKMRKQGSYNSRSTGRSGTRGAEDVGFNPFRSSSESVLGSLSNVNVSNRKFTFGAGSGSSSSNDASSSLGDPSVVLDDLQKMHIDSDNAVFKFKAFGSDNDKRFNESMVDQLPKEVNRLNIGDSCSTNSRTDYRFMNPFRSNVDSELQNEMRKMNLGKANVESFVFGRNSKSDEHLVGKSEFVSRGKEHNEENNKADLISDRMGKMKVGGDRDESFKSFVFGSNSQSGGDGFLGRSEPANLVKADLISDKMRELKVGGSVDDTNPLFSGRDEGNVKFTFSSKLDNTIGAQNVEFKTPEIKSNFLFGAKNMPESRLKKKKGKVRKPVIGQPQPKHDFVFGQRSTLENPESYESYSPMDVSPYNEILADNYSRGTSVTSDDATSQMKDQISVSSESHVINSNNTTDEDLLVATRRLNVNDADVTSEVSEVETFKSAKENIEYSSDSFATALDSELSSTATSGSREKTSTPVFKFSSKLEDMSNDNFTFAASVSGQGQLSPETRQNKKKHRLKTGQDSYGSTSDAKNSYASSSSSSILSSVRTQKVDKSTISGKNEDNHKPINELQSKHGTLSTASVSIAAEETCEKWRLRGNQAYGNGDFAKAEDYYTQGLNSVSETEPSKGCLRALMLCYSNRAATRISLGRMKEALKDCLMAAAIDPSFLKVQVRAAHCYLAIGEVENATLQYMKCLQSGNDVCMDRKLLVEASEGLEKARKLTECIKQYNELSRRTPEDLEFALKVVEDALQLSSYSEQLLRMKADILLMLQRYDHVIQMCEQTLSSAETDTPKSSSSWRSNMIVKSYFYLGKLEEANEFIKKQENSGYITERLESMSLDSIIPLADTIRELLTRKAAGNEAYKAGKYADAVEHYTSALSCSVESRPFAAICYCNRAAAYRGLGQVVDAIADCSLSIALDPTYHKAISRRASLYEMIRDYGLAAIDLRRLVSLLTTSQMDEKGFLAGASGVNELIRKTQLWLNNIEEESRKEIPLNMYLILGVESTAAASEIKKAYRKAALKHHPDKAARSVSRSENGDDGLLWKEIAENVYKDADRLFKMIGEAYAILSNSSKRSQYDMDEEMRNEVNKYNSRSSSGRMATNVQSPFFERSASRRWQEKASSSFRYTTRYS